MPPLVSIVVPVCDSAPWLARCLDSLLAQTLPQLEIILVDDASRDGSAEICACYAAQYPGRMRCIALPQRRGPGAARNAGIAVACGEFLGFVDSDDAAVPEMYAELYVAAVGAEADIVVCGFTLIDGDMSRQILPASPGILETSALLMQKKIQPSIWNKLFRRSFIEQTKVLFPESRCAEDMAFVFLLLANNPRVYAVGKSLYRYYQHSSGLTVDILHRVSTLESLRHIKRCLKSERQFAAQRLNYIYMYILHAFLYPLHLLLIYSLVRGNNRWRNIKNTPKYLFLCFKYFFGE